MASPRPRPRPAPRRSPAERRPGPPRVLCINGVCNYDHLRALLHYVRLAFEEVGATCRVLDLARGTPGTAERAAIRAFAPDFAFSFNLLGAELADPVALPLVTWMVDEPYYHPHWKGLLGRPGIRTYWAGAFLLPQARALGARDPRSLILAGRALPVVRPEDRDIEVLFAGSAADPVAMRASWSDRFGPAVARVMEDLLEAWAPARGDGSLPELYERVAAELGVRGHEGLERLSPLLLGEVNRYVRARDRLAVLRALADLPRVTVIGDGWPALLPDARFTFRSAVPFTLYEEAVLRSKITLAAQPVHPDGASERYFWSMANGSALVASENRWLDEAYREGETHLAYPLHMPEEARIHLEGLLEDEAWRREMADAARAETLARHTFTHRARSLLEDLGLRSARAA